MSGGHLAEIVGCGHNLNTIETMIKLFRNIRKKLAAENKVMAYLRYAVGEILLVVIGILIALQVNNWNEQRKSNEKFNAVLEQIYTIVDQDVQSLSNFESAFIQQSNIIDSLIYYPEKIDPALLPSLLYYADIIPNAFTSQAAHQMDLLEFNPQNLSQSRLYKSIASYVFLKQWNLNNAPKHITQLLIQYDLPEPALISWYFNSNNIEKNIARGFYTKEQQKKALKIVGEVPFRVALKSAKSQNQLAILTVQNRKGAAISILRMIKKYYPKGRLLYQDIGIVGNATTNKNWTENLPMTLINEQKSIWEANIKLGNGSLKFRDGNSWVANWGGETFPSGNTKWFGSDITVKKGYYKVTLNLTEKTYEFKLIQE